MSTNLYWRPVPAPKRNYLAKELKYAIAPRFFGQDGSLNTKQVSLTMSDRDYLYGLMDAGVKDAEKLLKAIEDYGEIQIQIPRSTVEFNIAITKRIGITKAADLPRRFLINNSKWASTRIKGC